MFFVVRSNDSFNFPLGLIKYIVIVTDTCLGRNLHHQMHTLLILKGLKGIPTEDVRWPCESVWPSGKVGKRTR